MYKTIFCIFLAFLMGGPDSTAQVSNPEAVQAMVERYKTDPRGPYLDIRWFCQDGTNRPARDPCPNKPGNQHARLKDEVIALAKKDHIFLGQILTNTPHKDFWDADKSQSRLKQYQLEQYLRRMDDGWINRRAQFYRGAIQVEDEHAWGIDFYQWLLTDPERVVPSFFLIRQSARDVPHATDDQTTQLVRSLSKVISDAYPAFQDLRIKIHGTPDESDIQQVRNFQENNRSKIPESLHSKIDQLIREMTVMYKPFEVSDFEGYVSKLTTGSPAARQMAFFLERYPQLTCPNERCKLISHTAMVIRQHISTPGRSTARLAMLDLSTQLEDLMLQEASRWRAGTLDELLFQIHYFAEAATAFGFLEQWEWQEVRPRLQLPLQGTMTLEALAEFSEQARNVTEWGSGMVRAHYMPVIQLYQDFEPMAAGFFDDRIRSSVLLYLGQAVSRLGDVFAREAGFANQVMNIKDQSAIRGLNPGYALGELIIVTGEPEKVTLSPDKIYVFHHPPENLKPVGGIMTVTEGNLVSHVQLLARNLAIPNAVVSTDNMNALKAFHGKQVFYAVSNKGTVIMKAMGSMDNTERNLFKVDKRKEERILVPVHQITLENPRIYNLREVNSSHSGKLCGPKAANLGQLKKMFPQNVVEGLVLPFSVFRQHMDQMIPGQSMTYWVKMNSIFDAGETMRKQGKSESEVETFLISELEALRVLIRKMPLLPSMTTDLMLQFNAVFKAPIGKVPVFIRSDTNMEDLKEFTGAGLNLTVFNVLDEEKILQGIRDVWASPYTERSFRWRQRYLRNPENVYPSILIIPSVNADNSGVLITKGVTTGRDEDVTVAFNKGVGGAVDGQAAESWLLAAREGYKLLAPAREASFLTIPASGGSKRQQAVFDRRILSPGALQELQVISSCMRSELPKVPGMGTTGPFDIELGFKDDHLWLFQVRPFVENKQAAASDYLTRITPTFDPKRMISLQTKP